ncbi:MAG TPA: zinc ribbon domain-containing protein [Bacillota bacterium]|nr:zinc ribbon domain-containing protein [Bacillota bacterium]
MGRHAPGAFISTLGRRAESAGGYLQEFRTQRTRLSQTCHCGRVAKKPLSQRVHRCGCGVQAQRDLYSAFLARFVDASGTLRLHMAQQSWNQGAGELLHAADKAKAASPEGATRRHRNTGRSSWRAKTGRCGSTEARDAVPTGGGGESPRKVPAKAVAFEDVN